MSVDKDLFEGLSIAVELLTYLHSESDICRCDAGYECRFHRATRILDKYKEQTSRKGGGVTCITTGKSFANARQASQHYGINEASIGKNCKGITKSAGKVNGQKLVWRYGE